MTDTTEQKALALVNEVAGSVSWTMTNMSHPYNRILFQALCRAIEQHEAFRQEVSDAIVFALKVYGGHRSALDPLTRFIIPKPVDPLVGALKEAAPKNREMTHEEVADGLRAALAARGLEVRKIGEGE